MMNRTEKKRLKAALINALAGKLPISNGFFRMEAAPTASTEDTYLLVKVYDQKGSLETYLEVNVKETL